MSDSHNKEIEKLILKMVEDVKMNSYEESSRQDSTRKRRANLERHFEGLYHLLKAHSAGNSK